MPVVAGKEYPYTREGIAAAEAARSASPIRLDAERDIGLYELALAAAQAGALGGAVSGAGVRAIPQRDAIRAAAAATSDELFNQKNLEQAIRDSASYKNRTMFTRMHPDDFLALARDFGDFPDHVDPGPPPPGGWGPSPDKQARIRQAIESGVPLSDIPILKMSGEGRVYGHEGRHRALAMRGRGFESLPVELISSNIRWSEQQNPKDWDYQKELPSELGSESPERKTPAHRTRPAPYHTEGPLRGLPLDTPAIRRPIGRRIAGGLSRLGKEQPSTQSASSQTQPSALSLELALLWLATSGLGLSLLECSQRLALATKTPLLRQTSLKSQAARSLRRKRG